MNAGPRRWAATLTSTSCDPGVARVRITNPLASDESVLRATMITGLVRAWGKNLERGTGDVVLAEIGNVFTHPDATTSPRMTRGGVGGAVDAGPTARERTPHRRARSRWRRRHDRGGVLAHARRSPRSGRRRRAIHRRAAAGLSSHPCGESRGPTSDVVVGVVGEVDAALVEDLVASASSRRLGLLDVDFDALSDRDARDASQMTSRRCRVGTRAPSSTWPSSRPERARPGPRLRVAWRVGRSSNDVELFDVYQGDQLCPGTRSLAYRVRFSSEDEHAEREGSGDGAAGS